MQFYRRSYLLIIAFIIISNILIAFDKNIYLPKIPIYIPEESKALMSDSLLNEINNDFLYTIKDNKSESFYTISIKNTENKYRNYAFLEYFFIPSISTALLSAFISIADNASDKESAVIWSTISAASFGWLFWEGEKTYTISPGSDAIQSFYKIKYEEEKVSINKKVQLGGLYDDAYRNYFNIRDRRLSSKFKDIFKNKTAPLRLQDFDWNELCQSSKILSTHIDYIKLFNEVTLYKNLASYY